VLPFLSADGGWGRLCAGLIDRERTDGVTALSFARSTIGDRQRRLPWGDALRRDTRAIKDSKLKQIKIELIDLIIVVIGVSFVISLIMTGPILLIYLGD
jgi:hypothetical protein